MVTRSVSEGHAPVAVSLADASGYHLLNYKANETLASKVPPCDFRLFSLPSP
jgi:hypothetical protein